MIVVLFIVTHIIVFVLGYMLCMRLTQAYIRHEIMGNKTPFTGKELQRLKEFVGYEEK